MYSRFPSVCWVTLNSWFAWYWDETQGLTDGRQASAYLVSCMFRSVRGTWIWLVPGFVDGSCFYLSWEVAHLCCRKWGETCLLHERQTDNMFLPSSSVERKAGRSGPLSSGTGWSLFLSHWYNMLSICCPICFWSLYICVVNIYSQHSQIKPRLYYQENNTQASPFRKIILKELY